MSSTSGKKEGVFLTGASGFIGSHLARRLLSQGYEVHLGLRKTSDTKRITDILPDVKCYDMDILNFENVSSALHAAHPSYIIHLATSIVYSGHAPSDDELIGINITGTANVIRAASDIDYKCLLNTGSSSEYGMKHVGMSESDICEPYTVHGVTKLASILYGQAIARQYKKPIIGMRMFSPYGPYDDHRRFITTQIVKAFRKENLKLSDPQISRDYIYIDDAVNLYIEVIKSEGAYAGEIFNVGTGAQSTFKDVIDVISREMRLGTKNIAWNAFPRAPYDTDYWKADMSKVFRTFKWRPLFSLEDGLKRTIAWIKEHPTYYGNVGP